METTPLLSDTVDAVVDYKGRQVFRRSNKGGWRSAYFIIGNTLTQQSIQFRVQYSTHNYSSSSFFVGGKIKLRVLR